MMLEVKDLQKEFYSLRRLSLFSLCRAIFKSTSFTNKVRVLKGVTFDLQEGDKLALIGKNGSGKTTLLRILSGIYQYDTGVINLDSLPQALFKCWIGFNGDLSVLDNMVLFAMSFGMSRNEVKVHAEQILEFCELGAIQESPMKSVSKGQQQRLALTIFLLAKGPFLILDEAFASLDSRFISRLNSFSSKLSDPSTSLIMTSHDPEVLKQFCNRAIWLDEGRIVKEGPLEEVLHAYRAG